MKLKKYNLEEKWIAGISDGPSLSCSICGNLPKFPFVVDNNFWREVVPKEHRLGVICLSCFDKLATEKGLDISTHLESVQFTGIGKTIKLVPSEVYYYRVREKGERRR